MVLIIAEVGVNHNGDLNNAKKLIDIAAEAGANVVKFQTFKSEELTTNYAPLADYQTLNSPELKNQSLLLKKLQLSEKDHFSLSDYSREKGIEFLSTAFTVQSVDLLSKIELKRWKIPSGEINNFPLLKKIANLNMPTILSTGMASLGEIEKAIDYMLNNNLDKDNLTILHCTTAYPTSFSDANLKAIKTLKDCFKISVGYSDHTLGIEASIAAVALGATVIEKHITLDRNLPGPDHKASIEPSELFELIKSIRNISLALGDGIKKITKSEILNKNVARKSIVAIKKINKGDLYTLENINLKRPGTGLPPDFLDYLLGKKANRDYKFDQQIDIN